MSDDKKKLSPGIIVALLVVALTILVVAITSLQASERKKERDTWEFIRDNPDVVCQYDNSCAK